ncbi:MAG TPA: plastocyanin/azurin family copper-binding protein [Microthrixaceae bacterium]|nr:plastocyanin/azurin family copper-binding protein [Microthrixaceae bacterium]HNN39950.1 plastocyanin/azurin family copper-binding protein [Microthrixaceae bacterium]
MTSRGIRSIRLALIAGVGLLAVACGGGSSSSFSLPDGATWTKESGNAVTVDTRDNVFVPQFIEVKKGTEVTWDNTGRNRHNVLPDDEGDFESIEVDELDPGEKASRTFDEVGEFGYYCSLHGTATKGMFGAIKVVE